MAHWSQILSLAEPDLLLVQETKDPRHLASAGFEPLNLAGAAWSAVDGRPWGSAVFTPQKNVVEIPVPGFRGWVTGGEVGTAAGTINAFSVHMPPEKGSYLRSASRLLDALGPIARGSPLLLGGDWNFTVCRRDAEDPRAHRRGEVEFLSRLAEEFGLVPAWRLAHPTGALPQTLRWMKDPETPYHCDGIFLPTYFAGTVESAVVLSGPPWQDLSDHNPVVVEWPVPEPRERHT